MGYDGKERADNELYALEVVSGVLKGAGTRQGTFFLAAKTGDQASIVCERAARDPSGAKLLQKGRRMRGEMGNAEQFAAGVLIASAKKELTFRATDLSGSLGALKKRLVEDLLARGSEHKEDNPAAARLARLVKAATFADAVGVEDPTPEGLAGEGGEGLDEVVLTNEELGALGLADVDVRELDLLEGALSGQISTIAGVFGAPEESGLQQAAIQQTLWLTNLSSRLGNFTSSSLPKGIREELRKEVQRELQTLLDLVPDGDVPWPDLGGTVDRQHALALKILRAQGEQLRRDRGTLTMGVESEFTKSRLRAGAKGIDCVDCSAVAGEPCEGSDSPTTFHTSRVRRARVEDHAPVIRFTVAGEPLITFQFETQGRGAGSSGTLEAVSVPVEPETEAGARKLRAITLAIEAVADRVKELGEAVVSLGDFVRPLHVDVDESAFALVDGAAERLLFSLVPGSRKAPQITATHSMTTLCDTFARGFPSDSDQGRDRMLKDAAADAKDIVRLMLSSHKRERTEDFGPSMEGFVALLVQDAQRTAIHWIGENRKGSDWKVALFDGRDGNQVTHSWHWGKDQLALLPKTPLGVLANEGGLTRSELEFLREHEKELLAYLDQVLKRQHPQLHIGVRVEQSGGPTFAQHLRTTLSEPPPKPNRRTTTPFPPGAPEERDQLAYEKWPRDGRVATEYAEWLKVHKESFDLWVQISRELWEEWVRYLCWYGEQVWDWGWLIGDGYVHPIEQKDGGRMRVATEYRMLSGEPTMSDVASRVLTSLVDTTESLRRERLQQTLGA